MSPTLLTLARIAFIGLLYLFLWVVARTVRSQISIPRAGSVWRLTIIEPGAEAARHETIDRSHIVGRGDAADIAIHDPSVSDLHFRIAVAGDSLTIQDLGSTNGTFVNGDPLQASATLTPGDTIRIGRTIMEVQ